MIQGYRENILLRVALLSVEGVDVVGNKKGINEKNKDTKTSNYFGKWDKFLCKTCFEPYHTRSNV